MNDRTVWLASLKAGDPVVVGGTLRDDRRDTVERVTPKQLVVGSVTFNRETGRERGCTAWHVRSLMEPTPERVQAIDAREAASYLSNVPWYTLSQSLVLDIARLVKIGRRALESPLRSPTKESEIVADLRWFADSLDVHPDTAHRRGLQSMFRLAADEIARLQSENASGPCPSIRGEP